MTVRYGGGLFWSWCGCMVIALFCVGDGVCYDDGALIVIVYYGGGVLW